MSSVLAPVETGRGMIDRLNAVPFSRWHMRARIIMGSATLFDAFDALSLAFVLPVLKDLWHLTPGQIGTLISAGYVGQFLGALFFGALAEKIGRIRSATLAVALMSVMGIGCALTGRYEYLLLCRFIQGIGVGGEVPVAAAYINEVSPPLARGRFFMLYEMIFPIGLMLTGQIGAWLVPAVGWQAMFLVGGIPGLFVAFLIARLPESPRWLIERGRAKDAEVVVAAVEASTTARCAVPATSRTPAPAAKKTRWRDLLSQNYRRRTLVVWTLWFLTYLVANGLNNWLPTLYKTVYNLDLKSALRAASMTNVVQVFAVLACAFVIDRVGRKNWASTCYFGAAILFGVLAFLGGDSVVRTGVLATLAYGVLGSTNVLLYLYTPEIYPTGNRAVATGVATAWLRLGSTAGPA
ncbi:MAG TPA: MFS transporter, partial [Opitutaceae bacterium]|nr:MFS transporter [Opitutaceae bacterium]